jgi:hypothetical protein
MRVQARAADFDADAPHEPLAGMERAATRPQLINTLAAQWTTLLDKVLSPVKQSSVSRTNVATVWSRVLSSSRAYSPVLTLGFSAEASQAARQLAAPQRAGSSTADPAGVRKCRRALPSRACDSGSSVARAVGQLSSRALGAALELTVNK